MHLPPGVFPLRMIDVLVEITLQRPIAARRIGIQATARVDGEVGRVLHRLDGKVPRRLDHDTSLAAHPGDNRGALFVIMAPTVLTFLAAPTRSATQGL